MMCRRSPTQEHGWRSTVMRTATDAVEKASGAVEKVTAPPPETWRSNTMQLLESVVTPGTIPNIVVSFTVMTLIIPRIPNRFIASAAGFAVGSVLRG